MVSYFSIVLSDTMKARYVKNKCKLFCLYKFSRHLIDIFSCDWSRIARPSSEKTWGERDERDTYAL